MVGVMDTGRAGWGSERRGSVIRPLIERAKCAQSADYASHDVEAPCLLGFSRRIRNLWLARVGAAE